MTRKRPALFRGRHFEDVIILLCGRFVQGRRQRLIRAGIPEKVAMKISRHKTRAIFERYNIVDHRDIEDAGKKLADFCRRRRECIPNRP